MNSQLNPSTENVAETSSPSGRAPLRICLLGYRSHPYVGGQGIYIKYLSKALTAAGHQVDVISGPPYPEVDPPVKLIKMPSLDLFSAKNHATALRPRHLKSFSDTFEWWAMLTGGFAEPYTFSRRVAKYLKQHSDRYDIVHDNQCLGYGLLTIQERGLPVVATVHHPISRDRQLALDAAPNWRQRLLVRRWHSFLTMQKKVVQQLKHVVTVSEVSRHDIADAFDRPADDIKLVHNGIDTDVFRPMPEVTKKPNQLITTASADQPLKGLRYLLEALAQVRQSQPKVELLVIGKLKEGGPTAKLLAKLDLQASVNFVSGISTERLAEHYNESCIAVSPSLYEGFGLPAGEAMSCGIPIISSTGGALPEVVGDAGVIVEKGDSQALAEAIATLLQDPARQEELGQAGRARVEKMFSWKVAAEQFAEYYYQILEQQA